MVEVARAQGFVASERLVTDWASLGLLDHPERSSRGKGGGRGAHYAWGDRQTELFLFLLTKRPEVRSVGTLCPIPVASWMYWGDEWVPLRQVRRAVPTWLGLIGTSRSYERARANARAVVNTVAGATADRASKLELEVLIARAIWRKSFDAEVLKPHVEDVLGIDPGAGGGPIHFRVDHILDMLQMVIVAIGHLERLTTGAFYEARARQREAMLEYARDWPGLVAKYGSESPFEKPTIEWLLNRSCHHLLANIGLRILADRRKTEVAPISLSKWDPNELLSMLQQSQMRLPPAPTAIGPGAWHPERKLPHAPTS